MRWKKHNKDVPIIFPNDIRIIRKFLYFPLQLEEETRWLEYANIVQIYIYFGFKGNWYNERFIGDWIYE